MTENKQMMTLAERIKAEAELQQKVFPKNHFKLMKAKNGQFILPNGSTSSDDIDIIMLGFRWTRSYFRKEYDAANTEAPVCQAMGKIDTQIYAEGQLVESDLIPKDSETEKQHDTCEGCPHDEWGTGARGRGKKCNNGVRLAIISPDPSKSPSPLILDLTKGSIRAFKKALTTVLEYPDPALAHPAMHKMIMGFDNSKGYNQVVFKGIEPHNLPEEHINKAFTIAEQLLDGG